MECNPLLVVWMPVCTCQGGVMPYIDKCVHVCGMCVFVCTWPYLCCCPNAFHLYQGYMWYLFVRFTTSRGAKQALRAFVINELWVPLVYVCVCAAPVCVCACVYLP